MSIFSKTSRVAVLSVAVLSLALGTSLFLPSQAQAASLNASCYVSSMAKSIAYGAQAYVVVKCTNKSTTTWGRVSYRINIATYATGSHVYGFNDTGNNASTAPGKTDTLDFYVNTSLTGRGSFMLSAYPTNVGPTGTAPRYFKVY